MEEKKPVTWADIYVSDITIEEYGSVMDRPMDRPWNLAKQKGLKYYTYKNHDTVYPVDMTDEFPVSQVLPIGKKKEG